MPKQKTALIAGATGLIGQALLQRLLQDDAYATVYVLSRRPVKEEHPKLKQILIEDFDRLAEMAEMPQVQDIFCCLGTTMKKAGSKEAFRKVDYTYPFELAKLAAMNGASQYLLVSALGAKANSLFFYNRVKGEVEEAISKVSQFRAVHIFRPSLLLGEREENRAGEGFAQKLSEWLKPLMRGPFKKFRPIEGNAVAEAMQKLAHQQTIRGVHIHESEEIKALL